MTISTNGRLNRSIRRSFQNLGFVASYNASLWTNLFLKRGDDQLAITCLDSREHLDFGNRDLLTRLGGISREVLQAIGTRTAFITTFSVSKSEKSVISEANMSLMHIDDLAKTAAILDTRSTLAGATPEQLLLARQTSGMCRRFAIDRQNAGDLENAIVWRRRQSELRPMSPEAYWVLAGLQTKSGLLDEAEKAANHFLTLAPANASILLLLIDIKRKQGDADAALDVAKRAQAQFPDNLPVRKHIHELATMRLTDETAVHPLSAGAGNRPDQPSA